MSKVFLEKQGYESATDDHTVAIHVIASHDAADLAIAAICDELDCLPSIAKPFLMNYVASLRGHVQGAVPGQAFFNQLNDARNGLKHNGNHPNLKQWADVLERTYNYVTEWCETYLHTDFVELSNDALLPKNIRSLYDSSKKKSDERNYKAALEELAIGLAYIFARNLNFSGVEVGKPEAEDALRLQAFGVNANDFLALQRFLPLCSFKTDQQLTPRWSQSSYGHPGNWTERTVKFCQKMFVEIALKLEAAPQSPSAILRDSLFDQEIEALHDNVEIFREVKQLPTTAASLAQPDVTRLGVRVLKKGEKLRGHVMVGERAVVQDRFAALFGGKIYGEVLTLNLVITEGERTMFGTVNVADVKVMNVPKETDVVAKFFPDLQPFEWEP